MKLHFCLLVCIFVIVAQALPTSSTDSFLGESFKTYAIETGDYSAVLVHREPSDSTKKKAAILYVHGFNDYFFQSELAARADSAGYDFFAIDLHAHGRAYKKGEARGHLRNIPDYYPELDSAVSYIKQITDSLPVVLLGHSTGGLITTLYTVDRDNGRGFAALVLNSPFFEFNFNKLVTKIGVPIISRIGASRPNITLPTSSTPFYGYSLHKKYHGEWAFDTTLKSFLSPAQDFGWARAIHLGQFRVQKGRSIAIPVLVMHSSCSLRNADEWVDEFTRCDAVLDVDDIEKYGARLGKHVTTATIEGGLHDLYLSKKPVRENAYKITFDFLDAKIVTSP